MRARGLAPALALLVGVSGCAPFLIGAGAVGGYAVSRDSVVDHFDLSRERVYRAGVAAIQKLGAVTLEDPKRGRVDGVVQEANVRVTLRQLTERTVELRIRARNKLLMPRVAVAQKVYGELRNHL